MSDPKCNRCRKHLTATSSVIRGIGPVCARRILSHIATGLRGKKRHEFLNALFASERNDNILSTYDSIVLALKEGDCSLDVDHRNPLSELLISGSRLKVVEYVLTIYADICNQLCRATTVAVAVKNFFTVLGLGDDEATKAYKRLIKLASKVSTF